MSLIYTADSSTSRHRLYIGGRSDAKNRDKLQQWGIRYILNVSPAKDAGIQVCFYIICVCVFFFICINECSLTWMGMTDLRGLLVPFLHTCMIHES